MHSCCKWDTAQKWEGDWWSTCHNTLGEELKQMLYANRMGLKTFHDGKSPYNIDLEGKSVLDVGGGPVSLLLKCVNFELATVVDPLEFPNWVMARYALRGIEFSHKKGENLNAEGWDEVWLYNVLQHTEDPVQIIKQVLRAGNLVRVFEWLDTAQNVGHPHSFTHEVLDSLLGGEGRVETLVGQANCYGKAYYGVFHGGK